MPDANRQIARLERAIERLETELDGLEEGEHASLVKLLGELRHCIAALMAAERNQVAERELLDRVLDLVQHEDEALWLRVSKALDA